MCTVLGLVPVSYIGPISITSTIEGRVLGWSSDFFYVLFFVSFRRELRPGSFYE